MQKIILRQTVSNLSVVKLCAAFSGTPCTQQSYFVSSPDSLTNIEQRQESADPQAKPAYLGHWSLPYSVNERGRLHKRMTSLLTCRWKWVQYLDITWATSPAGNCYHPHSTLPVIIITQPKSSFHHPKEDRRLSWPRHCSKRVQPMPRLYIQRLSE